MPHHSDISPGLIVGRWKHLKDANAPPRFRQMRHCCPAILAFLSDCILFSIFTRNVFQADYPWSLAALPDVQLGRFCGQSLRTWYGWTLPPTLLCLFFLISDFKRECFRQFFGRLQLPILFYFSGHQFCYATVTSVLQSWCHFWTARNFVNGAGNSGTQMKRWNHACGSKIPSQVE